MWTIVTLILWLGGLALASTSVVLGGSMMMIGVVSAAKAYRTPNDLETFWGLAFGFMLIIAALALLSALWTRLS